MLPAPRTARIGNGPLEQFRVPLRPGHLGEPVDRPGTPVLVAYAATNGAVKMFTQGLARELGPRGITVNNVQPGPIDTDLNPANDEWAAPQIANTALKRYGHVDDIAAMVSFVGLFELLGIIFLALIPLVLLMKRPGHGGPAVGAH